mgnify:CR=1 FL=1
MSSVPTTPTTSRPSPALRTPFSSPRQYTRLSSDDEADDAEPPAAVQPPRLDPETAQELQRKFLSHVARARRRQTDAGAVVQVIIHLGEALGLSVTAEGVETETQRDT